MAYSVIWNIGEITIPAADLSLVSGATYNLDMAAFHKEIRRLEWAFDEGLPWPQILDHTIAKLDFAGADYAPFDEIINGYEIKFEAGIERVNLLGSNNNLVDVLLYTGVSLVSQNSAGLQRVEIGGAFTTTDRAVLASAEFHSRYNGSVYYDADAGVNGDGTRTNPFNVENDVVDFAEANNITHIHTFNDWTLTRQVKNFHILGVGASMPTVSLGGQEVGGTRFHQVRVEGAYLGAVIVQECHILGNFALNGNFEKCGIDADLSGVDGSKFLLKDCSSLRAGFGVRPTLDMLATGTCKAIIHGYEGGLTVSNCNQPTDALSLGMSAASVTLDASNDDGDIVVRGVGYLVNNAVVSITDEHLSVPYIALAVWSFSVTALTNAATIGGFIAKKLLTLKKFVTG